MPLQSQGFPVPMWLYKIPILYLEPQQMLKESSGLKKYLLAGSQ